MKGNIDCPCGCGMTIKPDFKSVLERIEREANTELFITSGARCELHNRVIGASKNSAHTLGKAADIATETSHKRFIITRAIYKLHIRRTGRSNKRNFIHVDIACGPLPYPSETLKEYPQNVDWDYDD